MLKNALSKFRMGVIAATALALSSLSTQAAVQSFSFSYSGGPGYQGVGNPIGTQTISASGIFSTISSGSDWLITGITGVYNGDPITGLFSPGGFQGNDNILSFPGEPHFTVLGVAFTTALYGSIDVYFDAAGQFIPAGSYGNYANNTNIDTVINGSITAISAVPELSTWAMMLFGFLGLGLITYRRAKKLDYAAV